jgi:hypothetical protein
LIIGSSETEFVLSRKRHRENLLYVGLNAALVSSAIILGFLGRYFELQFVALHGYGAHTKLSFLVAYAFGLTLLDGWLVKNTINKQSNYERILVLALMCLFVGISLFIIVVNVPNEVFVLNF